MTFDEFSQSFQGAKKVSDEKYTAICPICSRAIEIIKQDEKGDYVPVCSTGCNPNDIIMKIYYKPKVKGLSTIAPQKTDWLWFPYIPQGKITIMQGDPGNGKTMLALYIATVLSNGDFFYNEDLFYQREPSLVLYETAEDGLADTIVPRLIKQGANLENIISFDDEDIITFTSPQLEAVLNAYRPKLMIFDPIQAYLGADVDMHRANEIRPVMKHLGDLAEKYDCTMLLIAHMNKGSQSQALYRTLGSIDIVGAARSMLTVGKNPDNKEQKIMAHEKSNLAKHGDSIAFHMDFSADSKGIVFDGTSTLTANEITSPKPPQRQRQTISLDEAMDFLSEQLEPEGFIELGLIKAQAELHGIPERTLYRAKSELDINHISIGFGKEKKSYWFSNDYTKEEIKLMIEADKGEQQEFEEITPANPPW